MSEENTNQSKETIIAAGVNVEGDLVSDGDIRVDGQVTGKIKTKQNLYVGSSAEIDADVEAQNADLAGQVKGQVNVSDLLTLQESGKLYGDINCARLTIAEGAFFSGNCSMEGGEQTEPVEEAQLEETEEEQE